MSLASPRGPSSTRSARCKTSVVRVVDPETAAVWFDYFYSLEGWVEGVRSKTGFTRLALPLDYYDRRLDPFRELVPRALALLSATAAPTYEVLGVYVNLYENGEMWTPSHSHPGQHQLVFSFGATRSLVVGKTTYRLEPGEVIIFGSGAHSVPKEPDVKTPRISVAVFLAPCK